MTIPEFALLGFAVWTIIVPLGAVGYYRWSRILAGAAPIHAFRADAVAGPDWYRRAMRAHANCVENLPVFGSIILLTSLCGVASSWVDALALVILVARVAQSSVHMARRESARTVSVRFTFFLVQVLCMIVLAGLLLVAAGIRGHAASHLTVGERAATGGVDQNSSQVRGLTRATLSTARVGEGP
jgi:uncharacterized MAPEG superfamily protein